MPDGTRQYVPPRHSFCSRCVSCKPDEARTQSEVSYSVQHGQCWLIAAEELIPTVPPKYGPGRKLVCPIRLDPVDVRKPKPRTNRGRHLMHGAGEVLVG